MTTIEKIKEMNKEIIQLKDKIPKELSDLIGKAQNFITPTMKEEIEKIIKKEIIGSYLYISYDNISTDSTLSDYYTEGYRLAYNTYGRIVVCRGETSDFEGRESSIKEAILCADTIDIEGIYALLYSLVDSIKNGKLIYEI